MVSKFFSILQMDTDDTGEKIILPGTFGRSHVQYVNFLIFFFFSGLTVKLFPWTNLILSWDLEETKEVWKLFIKVRSVNTCLLSWQFYYTLNIVCLIKEKSYTISILISLLKLSRSFGAELSVSLVLHGRTGCQYKVKLL